MTSLLNVAALLLLASAASAAPHDLHGLFLRRQSNDTALQTRDVPARCPAVRGCHKQDHIHSGAPSTAKFCTAGDSEGRIHLCGVHSCADENACAGMARAAVRHAQDAGISVSGVQHFCGTKAQIDQMMSDCGTDTSEEDNETTTIIIMVFCFLAAVCVCGGCLICLKSKETADAKSNTMEGGVVPAIATGVPTGTVLDTNTDLVPGETTTPYAGPVAAAAVPVDEKDRSCTPAIAKAVL